MIIDPDRMLSGFSIPRMSEYLSLCKIDCLVRKVVNTTPSCHVDQPSKVGTARTMIFVDLSARPVGKSLVQLYREKLVSTASSYVRSRLSKLIKNPIDSIYEVALALVSSESQDSGLGIYLIFEMIFRTDNFANERNALYFCFVENQQDTWVKHLANTFAGVRHHPDCIISVRNNQIQHFIVPKVERRN